MSALELRLPRLKRPPILNPEEFRRLQSDYLKWLKHELTIRADEQAYQVFEQAVREISALQQLDTLQLVPLGGLIPGSPIQTVTDTVIELNERLNGTVIPVRELLPDLIQMNAEVSELHIRTEAMKPDESAERTQAIKTICNMTTLPEVLGGMQLAAAEYHFCFQAGHEALAKASPKDPQWPLSVIIIQLGSKFIQASTRALTLETALALDEHGLTRDFYLSSAEEILPIAAAHPEITSQVITAEKAHAVLKVATLCHDMVFNHVTLVRSFFVNLGLLALTLGDDRAAYQAYKVARNVPVSWGQNQVDRLHQLTLLLRSKRTS